MERPFDGTDQLIRYIEIDLLPRLLQDLVGIIGLDSAYRFTQEYGGQIKYIAKSPGRTSMRFHMAPEALKKVCYYYGGMTIEVPKIDHFHKQVRNLRILHALEAGCSRAQVARDFNLGVRQIGNIKRAYLGRYPP